MYSRRDRCQCVGRCVDVAKTTQRAATLCSVARHVQHRRPPANQYTDRQSAYCGALAFWNGGPAERNRLRERCSCWCHAARLLLATLRRTCPYAMRLGCRSLFGLVQSVGTLPCQPLCSSVHESLKLQAARESLSFEGRAGSTGPISPMS
mmetsp:Transcript_31460/g.83826  ORF Transcript_31460/g.83826 Transcript_31460/m.83826 type:complete len:150 (-) Transcript_31460:291-740(-)